MRAPLLLALALPLTLGCADGRKKPAYLTPNEDARDRDARPAGARGSAPSNTEEARSFQDLQTLFGKQAHAAALEKIVAFEKKFPDSELAPQVRNFHGLILLQRKQPEPAIQQFQLALASNGEEAFHSYLLFNLASAQFDAKKDAGCQETLENLDFRALDPQTRIKFHYLKARVLNRAADGLAAANEVLEAAPLAATAPGNGPKPGGNLELLERQLKAAVAQIKDSARLRELFSDHRKSPLALELAYGAAKQALALGAAADAEYLFRAVIDDHPDSVHEAEAQDRLRDLQSSKVVGANSVGVLLPMTGRFAAMAERSLRGVELAFRAYNTGEADSKITLIVEDSGETAEDAVRGLENLARVHKVSAVIGPLLSKGIDDVARRAQELGIPMISLSQQRGEHVDFHIHGGVTSEAQAREIARFAVKEKGKRKIAILFPDDKFGRSISQYFWDAVEGFGGEIVGYEAYPPEETDFREVVDKLAGLHYKDARLREIEHMKELRAELNITKNDRKNAQYFTLPPAPQFDAVFIPDHAKKLGQILPTFEYRDVTDRVFLGISTWNSEILPKRAGTIAEKALFVDIFHPDSANKKTRLFTQKFTQTFGEEATTLEALAYDAASILENVLLVLDTASASRTDVRDGLARIRDFPGVTGRISYSDGQFARDLKLLRFQKGQVVEDGAAAEKI